MPKIFCWCHGNLSMTIYQLLRFKCLKGSRMNNLLKGQYIPCSMHQIKLNLERINWYQSLRFLGAMTFDEAHRRSSDVRRKISRMDGDRSCNHLLHHCNVCRVLHTRNNRGSIRHHRHPISVNFPQQQYKSAPYVFDEMHVKKPKERIVHLDCVNKFDPYHECTEVCYKKIEEAAQRIFVLKAAYRKYNVRRTLKVVARIRRHFLTWQARIFFLKMRRQAIRIQAVFRGCQARRQLVVTMATCHTEHDEQFQGVVIEQKPRSESTMHCTSNSLLKDLAMGTVNGSELNQDELMLVPETLYLTIPYVDSFLSSYVPNKQRQYSCGVTSMLSASRLLKIELGNSTIKTFLRRVVESGLEGDEYPDAHHWNLLLQKHTSYCSFELKECVKAICDSQSSKKKAGINWLILIKVKMFVWDPGVLSTDDISGGFLKLMSDDNDNVSHHMDTIYGNRNASMYSTHSTVKEGKTKWLLIERGPRIKLQSLTIQNLKTVQQLQGMGPIHCELKTRKILEKSCSRCEMMVIDLGSSCFPSDYLNSDEQSRSHRAFEIILGFSYDEEMRVWSLGYILAGICTGDVLFQNYSPATLLARNDRGTMFRNAYGLSKTLIRII